MLRGIHVQNPVLGALLKESYRAIDLDTIVEFLDEHGTLRFDPLDTGLYGAVPPGDAASGSGYGHVWVRDNVYVAHALRVLGKGDASAAVARALLRYFERHRGRFEAIISGDVKPDDVMKRPHVRFDGAKLAEIAGQTWSHAQNDALGYFLWLASGLARAGSLPVGETEFDVLALFPRYFQAIRFWRDEDNGHWEEVRKVSASSIGVVVAGLETFQDLLRERADLVGNPRVGPPLVNLTAELIDRGRRALDAILPGECVQRSPLQNRRYDASLIFLLCPLGVVRGGVERLIVEDVARFLTGGVGIRRYLGDSYFAPDYDAKVSEADRTRDYSNDIGARDALLERIGDEAQWCLFDPMLSVYHGQRFLQSGAAVDRARQVHHLNRALGHITGPDDPAPWRCPELYYLRQGTYVPGPHIPLLWTQANLAVALAAVRASIDMG